MFQWPKDLEEVIILDNENNEVRLFKDIFEKETTLFGTFFKAALTALCVTTVSIIILSIVGSILNTVLKSSLVQIEDGGGIYFSAAYTVLTLIWILSIVYIIFGLVCQFYVQQAYLHSQYSTHYPEAPILFVKDEEYFRGKCENYS